MNKFLLAGASALALLGFVGTANAQAIDLDISLGEDLIGLLDTDFAGVYVNSAVNAARVDGSVNIDAAALVPGLRASALNLQIEDSTALALALGDITADLDVIGGIGIGVDGVAVGVGTAAQVGVAVVGNRISSAAELATTAIGAVNTGTIALAALSTREFLDNSNEATDGGSVDFGQSAADSASNTSNTAARAAAATTSLVIDGATTLLQTRVSDIQSSGPAAIVATNTALNSAIVDGSVNLGGATINDITGTATTAIGAVNTGTISNGLPGSITIVVGGDE